MADITHSSPVVTEDKLKDFYEDIKPFLGCPAYVTQEGDAEYYSTDEKVIGRWTNGKPLYQKVIDLGVLTNNKTVNHNIANIDTITDVQGMAYNSSGQFLKLSFINLSNSYYGSLIVDKTKISVLTSGISDRSGFVVLQFTKSTDSAVTTIEEKPTHYSTDEQVVGVWTNNKPIYQKTFSTTAPNAPSNGSYGYKSFAHGIQNLDEYVEISGVITSSEFSSMLPFFTDGGYKTKFNINATEISIANDATYANGRKVSITVKYTKSTD